MAWLERKGKLFRIRFRFGGKKRLVTLKTKSEREANNCLSRFDENLRLAERGRLEIPDDVDVGLFLLSDGKVNVRPQDERRAPHISLAELFVGYRENQPNRTKETNTLYTERIHMKHLERLIGASTKIHTISPKTLQQYVTARSKETSKFGRTVGSRTIKKELGTLTAVWNQWAIPQGLAKTPLSTKTLMFGKERAKPPFQTREQIDRQISRGGLTPDEQATLWDCLFLTLPEIDDVLEFVRASECPAFFYPLLVFAGHTGARRSEMLRSRIADFDFDAQVVMIREKKRDRSREETYRSVPITPALKAAMQAWLAGHPGGQLTFCSGDGEPITVQVAAKTFVQTFGNSRWSILPGFHCFRHSFISNCVAKGIDQRLIDQWVGHTTESMRRRYSHLIPKTSQEALLRVFS